MFNNTINKHVVLGKLGKDPEVRYMPNGNCVAKLSIATNEKWKNKETDLWEESTDWHNVTVFGKKGELLRDFAPKGSVVYIEGRSKTTVFKKDGIDQRYTEIIAFTDGVKIIFSTKPKEAV